MNRRYNLDYLLQLQKNARLYMVGITILAFFMAVSLCLYLEPWEPENSTAFWAQSDSDQVIAEQPQRSTETDAMQKQETEIQNSKTEPVNQQDSVLEGNETRQTESSQMEIPIDKPAEMQSVDLLQIAGFTAPCNGSVLYGYGIGYDPLYDDYRFHDAVCYQNDGTDIFAVTEGVIKQADAEADWQIILQCGEYQIAYQGVQICEIAAGEQVAAGQVIGRAGKTMCVKAARQF